MARAEAYPHAKFHLDPSNRLATIHQRHRQTGQTGQRTDSIGRTVLQTVAQKRCYVVAGVRTFRFTTVRDELACNRYKQTAKSDTPTNTSACLHDSVDILASTALSHLHDGLTFSLDVWLTSVSMVTTPASAVLHCRWLSAAPLRLALKRSVTEKASAVWLLVKNL